MANGQGRAVKAARDRLRMTQWTLAKAAGVGRATVQRIEGGGVASHETVLAVCAVLGLDATTLGREQAPAAVPAPVRPAGWRGSPEALGPIRTLNLAATGLGAVAACLAYALVGPGVSDGSLTPAALLMCMTPLGIAATGILSAWRPRAMPHGRREAVAYGLFVLSGFAMVSLVSAALCMISASQARGVPVGQAAAFGGTAALWAVDLALSFAAVAAVAVATAIPADGLASILPRQRTSLATAPTA